MVPTYEGLKSHKRCCIQSNYRLIIKLKFIPLDRKPQVRLELEPGYRPGMHFLVKNDVVFFTILGIVHRDIGVTKYIFGLQIFCIAKSDAHLCTRKNLASVQCIGLGDASSKSVGKAGCLVLAKQVGQDHAEFVTAKPADHVTFADNAEKSSCDVLDQAVANRMPETVIYRLEAFKIEEKDSKID